MSRREMIAGAATATAAMAAAAAPSGKASAEPAPKDPFIYCLNTSTLMGQKLPITEIVDIAGKAGYQAIEPWIGELDTYVKGGGSLPDLDKRIRDHGLTVESAIGFFDWIVDDAGRRKAALDEARRNMELVQKISGKRLAAPPSGATDRSDMDYLKAAERYRALLELGDQFGIVPQVEVWGFSKTIHRLGQAALIAIEANHPKACILADVYHIYKGGGNAEGLRMLRGDSMHCFHMNDYPANPPRETITDAERVYPGDGIAPLTEILRDLREIGYRGALSLELFNKDLWKQDALTVAKTGVQKMRAAVKKSLA